ncbi:type II toxin-antitoxin system RelE/ParE family toxin [Methylosinus sp. R-45379]|uniref:type II toxin-antitoxin system RelE/ParE family toxin n=1 Tax=Methylosinus sp. R-45379 TaxID=980563 RepID=UPI0004B7722F
MTGSYNVIFSPEAEAQLLAIYRWIAERATPSAAERFTGAIRRLLRKSPQLPRARDMS